MRSHIKYYAGQQIENNKVGESRGTYGRDMRYTRGWWGDIRKGDHWEDLDVWGRLLLNWIIKIWDGKK